MIIFVSTTGSLAEPLGITSTERQAKQCTRPYIFSNKLLAMCVCNLHFAEVASCRVCTQRAPAVAQVALELPLLQHWPHWIRPSPAPPWYSLALVQHRTSGAVQPWFSVPQHTTSLVQCYSSAPAWWCSLTNCNPLALSCTSLTHHCFSDFASISPPINPISNISDEEHKFYFIRFYFGHLPLTILLLSLAHNSL